MDPLKFICTSCGGCCRRVKDIPGFPEPVNEDGSCSHLDENNHCKIYETRPKLCKVSEVYDLFKNTGMTEKEFYILNNESCNNFIKEDGMSDDYLIDIKSYDV